jgi:hypothetical protein
MRDALRLDRVLVILKSQSGKKALWNIFLFNGVLNLGNLLLFHFVVFPFIQSSFEKTSQEPGLISTFSQMSETSIELFYYVSRFLYFLLRIEVFLGSTYVWYQFCYQ